MIHCTESEGGSKNQNLEGKHEGALNFRETLERWQWWKGIVWVTAF